MRKTSGFIGVLTLVLLPGSLAFGASVTGTVKAPDGAPFRGAFVQAQNSATKIMVSVLSDRMGHYRIENLPAGQYQLQIRAVGFRADPRAGVNLGADQNAAYEFALQKDMVRWSDLSQYQGVKLFPDAPLSEAEVATTFAGVRSLLAGRLQDLPEHARPSASVVTAC